MMISSINSIRESNVPMNDSLEEYAIHSHCKHNARCAFVSDLVFRNAITYYEQRYLKFTNKHLISSGILQQLKRERPQFINDLTGKTELEEKIQAAKDKVAKHFRKIQEAQQRKNQWEDSHSTQESLFSHLEGSGRHHYEEEISHKSHKHVVDFKKIPVIGHLFEHSAPTVLHPDVPITIYDAHHRGRLPGQEVYSNTKEQQLPTGLAKEAYDNAVNVLRFWKEMLDLRSFDDANHAIGAIVNYLRHYPNAFFDGKRMVYGNGNEFFDEFVRYLDVCGHEMWHAVTNEYLNYNKQSGAINESYSDIFGGCLVMFIREQNVETFDWRVGEGILTFGEKFAKAHNGVANYPLRRFDLPGQAYPEDSPIGADPQPFDYEHIYEGEEDNGGVHINSGIVNRLFYLTCKHVDDWKEPMLLWYETLYKMDNPDITIPEFTQLLIKIAEREKKTKLVEALKDSANTIKIPIKD